MGGWLRLRHDNVYPLPLGVSRVDSKEASEGGLAAAEASPRGEACATVALGTSAVALARAEGCMESLADSGAAAGRSPPMVAAVGGVVTALEVRFSAMSSVAGAAGLVCVLAAVGSVAWAGAGAGARAAARTCSLGTVVRRD